MLKLCFIDLETTGFDGAKNGLIQISGAIETPDTGKSPEYFNFRIRPFPDDVIEPEALKVNGVTTEDLQGFMLPEEAYKGLLSIFSRYVDKYNRVDKFHFVGYNCLAFDDPFLREWFKKNGDSFYGSWFWRPPVDVFDLAGFVLKDERACLPNFKLATVARYMGIDVDEAMLHDAVYDIDLTRQLYWLLNGRLH